MENTTASVDDVYCLELARRAVARAALHLGIEAATQEVLDVVGDILLQYLQRVGSTLAHLVEASRRSTQHCHALDALLAIELCTSPAVARVHAGLQSGNVESAADNANNASSNEGDKEVNGGSTSMMANGHRQRHLSSLPNQTTSSGNSNNEISTHPPTSWQSLAQFSLGPNWHTKPVEADLIRREEQQGRGGGKVGPSATTHHSTNDQMMGWVAPFPEEIPPFPHASPQCANPHRLPESEILLYATPTPKISATTSAATATTTTDKANNKASGGGGGVSTTTTENTTATKPSSTVLAVAKAEQTRMENHLNEIPEDVFTAREQPWGRIGAGEMSLASNNSLLHDGKSNEQKAGGGKNDNNNSSATMMAEDSNVAGKKRSLEQDTASSTAENGKKGDGDSSTDPPKKKAKLASSQSDDATGQKAKGNAETAKSDNAENSNGNAKLEETGQSTDAANLPSFFSAAASASGQNAQSRPPYIPVFLPPIPRQHKGSRGLAVVDPMDEFAMMKETVLNTKDEGDTSAATSESIRKQLRSALVQLGPYWGSGWDADTEETKKDKGRDNGKEMVHVPMGRVESGSQSNTAVIVPLGRASGSRVSRILEGSMDAANVQ